MFRRSINGYKRAILREIDAFVQTHPKATYSDFVLPDTLKCFKPGDNLMLLALNSMMEDQWVQATASETKSAEGEPRIAIRLNSEKRRAIDRFLSPPHFWRDPRFMIATIPGIFFGALGAYAAIAGASKEPTARDAARSVNCAKAQQ